MLARDMLATMVLMGIKRIVVTHGQINAKVIFDLDTQPLDGHGA